MNRNEHETRLIDALKAIGADYQHKHDSMTFAKNGFVIVVDYNPLNGDYIGAIMTYYVYAQLCDFYENMSFNLSLAQFAWTYGWGYDFSKDRMSAENAFKHVITMESAPYHRINRLSRYFNHDAMYLVREYVDSKPKGEFGIDDDYYLVGAFTNFNKAMEVACEAHAKKTEKSEISIIPVIMNAVYLDEDKPHLGGSWYIE